MSNNNSQETKRVEIITLKQLLTLKLIHLANKLENSTSPSFPKLKQAKDKTVETIKDELSAFSSSLSYLQAKRQAKKIVRNPNYAILLFNEINRK